MGRQSSARRFLKALSALLALGGPAGAAEFWLPSILSDHMVLQAGAGATLWGEDQAGQAITVRLAGQTLGTQADGQGRWQVRFKALKPGGPHTLSIEGSQAREIKDVLIGELWLGSGQSNMEFELRRSEGAEAALAKADLPSLRLFTVERTASFTRAKDVQGQWKVSTPESAAAFSALAWHFGLRLRQALDRPVGLVVAAWGGTPAEAWTPRTDLDALPALRPLMAEWDADPARNDLWRGGRIYALELRNLRLETAQGSAEPLGHAALPGPWIHSEKPGSSGAVDARADGEAGIRYHGRLQGGAWASASVPLAADGLPRDLSGFQTLRFQVRGQGSFIPSFSQADISDYDFFAGPAFELGPDWKDIQVRLDRLKQGGWGLPAKANPKGMIRLQFSPQVPFWPDVAELAYNGMIAPLRPFAFKGVLWYQGESNVGRAGDYPALLRTLVDAWRRDFSRPDLAFAVVQLPEYDETEGWKALQAAQAEAVKGLRAAVLVPALGLGDPNDIHPRRKAELGERLSTAVQEGFYPGTRQPDGRLP